MRITLEINSNDITDPEQFGVVMAELVQCQSPKRDAEPPKDRDVILKQDFAKEEPLPKITAEDQEWIRKDAKLREELKTYPPYPEKPSPRIKAREQRRQDHTERRASYDLMTGFGFKVGQFLAHYKYPAEVMVIGPQQVQYEGEVGTLTKFAKEIWNGANKGTAMGRPKVLECWKVPHSSESLEAMRKRMESEGTYGTFGEKE